MWKHGNTQHVDNLINLNILMVRSAPWKHIPLVLINTVQYRRFYYRNEVDFDKAADINRISPKKLIF